MNGVDGTILKKIIIFLVFYYPVYFIIQLKSPTYYYLSNKESLFLNEKMGEIFKMKPEVIFKVTKYHYKKDRYSFYDDEGFKRENERVIKISDGESI